MNSYYLNSLANSLILRGRRALKQSRVWETELPTAPIVKVDPTELVEPEDEDTEKEEEEQQQFIVEKLVNKCHYYNSRLRKMIVLYKVKWLGYDAEENTWATVDELAGAKESIAEFEQQRAVARQKQRRRNRVR